MWNAAGNRSIQIPNHANRDLTPIDIFFDQCGLMIALHDLLNLLPELIFIPDHRFQTHTHAGSLTTGFDKQWKFQGWIERLINTLKCLERRRWQSMEIENAFGHGFIQCQSQREHPRSGIGNAQHFQNSRNVCLA